MTTPTRLACLTPPGTAGIATLALRGPRAWKLVRQLTRRDLPEEPAAGNFWLVHLGGEGRGEADEVVVAALRGGQEPWLELHSHGGREVLRLLEEVFASRGVEVCTWQELELATTGDALHTLALKTLTGALTVRTAAIALDQEQGALARTLDAVQAALELGDGAEAARLLGELERYRGVGTHLDVPWQVVIAGAPNVGKSSLVNALAGYQRSIVSPLPGTTRDVVTTLIALDGWPVELADTAGWRDAEGALEREGIRRAGAALEAADLCLWVLDGAAPPVWPETNLERCLFVMNKSDLPAAWPADSSMVRVSAQTGEGLTDLCQRIAAALVPEAPPPGAAVPFSAALAAGLGEVANLCQAPPEALRRLKRLRGECG